MAAKSERVARLKAKRARAFRKKVAVVLVAVVFVAVLVVVYSFSSGNKPADNAAGRVVLVTSMGNVTVELYGDMPVTSGNFRNLTEHGIYDGTIFHRVVNNFVVQGGDATAKGTSVPTIPDELPNKHSNVRGSVAMAKTSAPNSATSQFYINLKDNLDLDSNYSVFGRVVEGMDVVDAIGNVATDANSRPLQEVRLVQALIIQ